MTIIDSQIHAYEANTPKRPWHSVPNWPDHVTGDEMVAAMDKVGVDGAIATAQSIENIPAHDGTIQSQAVNPVRIDFSERTAPAAGLRAQTLTGMLS